MPEEFKEQKKSTSREELWEFSILTLGYINMALNSEITNAIK